MHHFAYRGGVLHAEDVSLAKLAAEVGTPFYCYSTATLERHYRVFAEAFTDDDALICFSVKACPNLAVLDLLARQGAGMDVVSEGELRRALAVGVSPEKIAFSGVGKTRAEIDAALRAGIFAFNVESEPELALIGARAKALGVEAGIAIRVNPDVDAKTHRKIATGRSENKFGIPYEDALDVYRIARSLPNVRPVGVHMHIGSQITDLAPFENAFRLLSELVVALRADGFAIEFLNLGGGLGAPYRHDQTPPHPDDYARVVRRALGGLGCRYLFEPGRLIAANAGVLVSRVLYVKHAPAKVFTIVDAAMTELMRPTLYDAHHEIMTVAEPEPHAPTLVSDVVGPVCETGDYLALDRSLPELRSGDLIAIMTAGAYGAALGSDYNSRLRAPEVLVAGSRFAVVRPRPTYEQMLATETLPDWGPLAV